jgi:hypothetical protein
VLPFLEEVLHDGFDVLLLKLPGEVPHAESSS